MQRKKGLDFFDDLPDRLAANWNHSRLAPSHHGLQGLIKLGRHVKATVVRRHVYVQDGRPLRLQPVTKSPQPPIEIVFIELSVGIPWRPV